MKCEAENCNKNACFNSKGEKKPKFCKAHKLGDMINIKNKICTQENCTTQASFNVAGEKTALYCSKHKKKDMINIKSKKCAEEGCYIVPVYNVKGEKVGLYCEKHKKEDMINIKDDTCTEEGCITRASFNVEGEKKGLYCSEHKKEDMINVKETRKCSYIGCTSRPTYNIPGETVGLYCSKHKKEGMVDVVHKKCIEEGCYIRPYYNYEGEKIGLYCKDHKKEDMVCVSITSCLEEGCNVRPLFNFHSETKGIYCLSHRKEGMIDVVTKKCEHIDIIDGKEIKCDIKAGFGLLFENKRHCSKHKLKNEFAKNKPKCEVKNCKNPPYCTNDNTAYPKRCESHKTKDDVNIVETECPGCKLYYLIPEDRHYCEDCYDYNVTKVHHAKENRIKKLLEDNKIEYESHDKKVQDVTRCSLRRPDFVIDRKTYKIIIEVDEFQHSSYKKDCEILRMKQIYFDFGGASNIIFIRYNPDNFKDQYGENGNITPYSREKKLLDLIKGYKHIETIEEHLLVYYLFYDGYNGICEKVSIEPYK